MSAVISSIISGKNDTTEATEALVMELKKKSEKVEILQAKKAREDADEAKLLVLKKMFLEATNNRGELKPITAKALLMAAIERNEEQAITTALQLGHIKCFRFLFQQYIEISNKEWIDPLIELLGFTHPAIEAEVADIIGKSGFKLKNKTLAFYIVVKKGKRCLCDLFIKAKIDLNSPIDVGSYELGRDKGKLLLTPLQAAARGGQVEIFSMLLKLGAKPNIEGSSEQLITSVVAGGAAEILTLFPDVFRQELDRMSNENAGLTDLPNEKQIVIFFAKVISLNNAKMLEALFAIHASWVKNNPEKMVMLFKISATTGETKSLKFMLNYLKSTMTSIIDSYDEIGFTVLARTVIAGHLAEVMMLVEAGANIQMGVDNNQRNFIVSCLSIAAAQDRLEIFNYLKSRAKKIQLSDNDKELLEYKLKSIIYKTTGKDCSADHAVAWVSAIAEIIGVNTIFTTDNKPFSPLSMAIQADQTAMVKALVNIGADLFQKLGPFLPFCTIVSERMYYLLAALIKQKVEGAKLKLTGNSNLPQDLQLDRDSEFLDQFVEFGYLLLIDDKVITPATYFTIIKTFKESFIRIVKKFGADEVLRNFIIYGNAKLVSEFLNLIKIDLNTPLIANHMLPLNLASFYDDVEMAEVLIANGAKINFKDINNRSILHVACEHGALSVVQHMLKLGADINLIANYYDVILGKIPRTPIMVTRTFKKKSLEQYLYTWMLTESVYKKYLDRKSVVDTEKALLREKLTEFVKIIAKRITEATTYCTVNGPVVIFTPVSLSSEKYELIPFDSSEYRNTMPDLNYVKLVPLELITELALTLFLEPSMQKKINLRIFDGLLWQKLKACRENDISLSVDTEASSYKTTSTIPSAEKEGLLDDLTYDLTYDLNYDSIVAKFPTATSIGSDVSTLLSEARTSIAELTGLLNESHHFLTSKASLAKRITSIAENLQDRQKERDRFEHDLSELNSKIFASKEDPDKKEGGDSSTDNQNNLQANKNAIGIEQDLQRLKVSFEDRYLNIRSEIESLLMNQFTAAKKLIDSIDSDKVLISIKEQHLNLTRNLELCMERLRKLKKEVVFKRNEENEAVRTYIKNYKEGLSRVKMEVRLAKGKARKALEQKALDEKRNEENKKRRKAYEAQKALERLYFEQMSKGRIDSSGKRPEKNPQEILEQKEIESELDIMSEILSRYKTHNSETWSEKTKAIQKYGLLGLCARLMELITHSSLDLYLISRKKANDFRNVLFHAILRPEDNLNNIAAMTETLIQYFRAGLENKKDLKATCWRKLCGEGLEAGKTIFARIITHEDENVSTREIENEFIGHDSKEGEQDSKIDRDKIKEAYKEQFKFAKAQIEEAKASKYEGLTFLRLHAIGFFEGICGAMAASIRDNFIKDFLDNSSEYTPMIKAGIIYRHRKTNDFFDKAKTLDEGKETLNNFRTKIGQNSTESFLSAISHLESKGEREEEDLEVNITDKKEETEQALLFSKHAKDANVGTVRNKAMALAGDAKREKTLKTRTKIKSFKSEA